MTAEAPRPYPRTIQVADGPVTLRRMEPSDRDAMLAFSRALPIKTSPRRSLTSSAPKFSTDAFKMRSIPADT